MSKGDNGWGCSDGGNKDRFVRMHGDKLKYVIETGEWVSWDGSRWKKTQAYGKALETAKSIYDEAKNCDDTKGKSDLTKWALRSCNVSQLHGMLKLASEELGISASEFDNDNTSVNCKNGVVDLRTKELKAHTSDQLLMKRTTVDYDPNAQCPTWLHFLGELFESDQELIDYIQEALGYGLTGLVQEHCFFIFYGLGRNGKGVLTDTVRSIMGAYAKSAEFEVFLAKDNANVRVREEIGNLKGIRFAVASEADSNKRFSEALIKRLTGGDMRIGARMYGSSYEYQPTDKLFFLTNHLPAIKDATVGMWERVRVIPFNRQFLGDDQDKGLERRLHSERDGIFAWMVEGAYRFLQRGRLPEVPKVCLEAVAAYRDENDVLSRFIGEVGRKDLGAKVGVQEAHKALEDWCFENKEESVPIKFFRKNMAERGIKSKESNKGYVFLNFTLTSKPNAKIDIAKPIPNDNDNNETTMNAFEERINNMSNGYSRKQYSFS